ncbi:MAG TPA: prolyl oligopeptidase family serine peptidase [Armatimonadota bacterium]|nr:prolyl oligopeptidase family serine peptidase [Armatimonadota bacterium]
MQHIHRLLSLAIVALALVMVSTVPSLAQSANDLQQRFEARIFTDANGKTQPYRLLKPKNYDATKKYPLVLFMHGAGERGTDNQAQLRSSVTFFATDAIMDKYPCFVIAPQCPPDKRWVEVNWGDNAHIIPAEPSEPMRLTLLLLDTIQKEFNIDKQRLYVTGLSMGGFGTWDIIARHPNMFAAAIPVCGGGDEHTAAAIKKIPIWAFHGDQDNVVKTIRSRHMIEALQQAGGQPKYTEFLGVGHNAWTFAYCNTDVYTWLFAQHRKK